MHGDGTGRLPRHRGDRTLRRWHPGCAGSYRTCPTATPASAARNIPDHIGVVPRQPLLYSRTVLTGRDRRRSSTSSRKVMTRSFSGIVATTRPAVVTRPGTSMPCSSTSTRRTAGPGPSARQRAVQRRHESSIGLTQHSGAMARRRGCVSLDDTACPLELGQVWYCSRCLPDSSTSCPWSAGR